ncbi:MAG: succinate dehydrogenase, hydrophobic membrane anchor protein [Polaromonas sp.]
MKKPISGLAAWLVQRLSAVFMLAFIGFVSAHFLLNPPGSYEAWRNWVAYPGVSIAAFLFFTALLMHAWVGLRDVVLDYVGPLAARVAALSLIAVALLGVGVWILQIFWLIRA